MQNEDKSAREYGNLEKDKWSANQETGINLTR